jgi:hypothetical protein
MEAGGRQIPRRDHTHFPAAQHGRAAQMAKGIGLGVWAAIEQFRAAAMALESKSAG